MKPGKLQRSKEGAKIIVGVSTTVLNLLFYAQALCMNYVTETFLLVKVSHTEINNYCVLCTVEAKKREVNKKLCQAL